MVTRAQLSQERSRLRRDELLAAAVELFAEGGSRAITHRAVAARAGLPSATTTYYFASIDDLIREALGAHLAQWIRDIEALSAIDMTSTVDFDKTEGFFASVFAARGPDVAALELSIFLAAAREPALRDQASRAMELLESLAAAMLTRVGVQDPAHLAAAVVTLVAGTGLRRQSGLYSEDEEARLLTLAIRDMVVANLLGNERVDATIAALRDDHA